MSKLLARTMLAALILCPIALTACNDDNGGTRPRDTSFYAEAEFSIDLDVDGQTSFRVEGVSGSIEITGVQGTTQAQISGVRRVESDSEEDAEQNLANLAVQHSTTDERLLVKTSQPSKTEGRNYIVNYTISIPNNLKVTVVNAVGAVEVRTVQNGVTVTNVSGSVAADDILGGVNLTQTVGPIDASVTLPLGEAILMTTGTGDISLEIPQSTSATLSATVGVGSIVLSNLTLTGQVSEPNSLSGTIGKGNGSIVLAASVGDITISGTSEIDETVRFPLDNYSVWQEFGVSNPAFDGRYHCAEDAYGMGGTPVYAIADGVIAYSGPMSGYGWLIIVDHPNLDVYSLYGHLSTRESKLSDGLVKKGDRIAYLAYDDEDGSGGDYPDWGPHLHIGIRQGSKSDYPSSSGDDRWMAGYTVAYPTSVGWLNPTDFILEHSN
jgi:hypothetical protein